MNLLKEMCVKNISKCYTVTCDNTNERFSHLI